MRVFPEVHRTGHYDKDIKIAFRRFTTCHARTIEHNRPQTVAKSPGEPLLNTDFDALGYHGLKSRAGRRQPIGRECFTEPRTGRRVALPGRGHAARRLDS